MRSCARVTLCEGGGAPARKVAGSTRRVRYGAQRQDTPSRYDFTQPLAGFTQRARVANPGVVGVKVAALLLERWRARHVAFAMGLHPRLGGGSSCCVLDPEVLRMVLDTVDGK